jgi:hypothetical protein
MQRYLEKVTQSIVTIGWTKLVRPTVGRGRTAYPTNTAELLRLGFRYDFDEEVTKGDEVYNKFKMQPNKGKVPSVIKNWREHHGGTHAVMADVYVKKDGTPEDVREAIEEANRTVKE